MSSVPSPRPLEAVPFQSTAESGESTDLPLCVDLDGTLIKTDLLLESAISAVRRNPFLLLVLPIWILAGRAVLKRKLALRSQIDVALLPYREELLSLLHEEKQRGRSLLLVTGSDELLAQRVGDHLGIFEQILASDGKTNLTSRRKRDKLLELFGEAGFAYAGDSSVDLPVWSKAAESFLIEPSSRVLRAATRFSNVTTVVPRSSMRFRVVLSAFRVHQWLKNTLVFVPAFTAHRLLEPSILGQSFLAFTAFSLGATGVYLTNDLFDLENDREHPIKRSRPLASGQMPLAAAILTAPILMAAAFCLALMLSLELALLLLIYFILTLSYTLFLKGLLLVDVLCLAGLYTLRLFAGSEATSIPVSPWLLAFAGFLFLSLALVKRVTELLDRDHSPAICLPGRAYRTHDTQLLTFMGVSSGNIAVLVLALYIHLDPDTHLYNDPFALWALCPILFYWINRVWLLANRRSLHVDPVVFTLRDAASYILLGLVLLVILLAR